MVKLDLETKELIGLFILGSIDEKKLKKYLKTESKENLEEYVLDIAKTKREDMGEYNESTEEEPDEQSEQSEQSEEEDDDLS